MHVEAGENFYGGARQVAFLIEGLARRGIDNVVVCPEHSLTARRMGELPVRLRPIPMAGDLDLPLIFRLRRLLREEIGRARVGKECVSTCRSRWSPAH